MPVYYRPFPKVFDNEIEKYSSKPLPRLPSHYHFPVQSSASYESLLEHSVPSPSLLEGEEVTKLWSRCLSQYSVYSVDAPSSLELSRSDSLDTISGSFDSPLTPDHRDRRETLLPPLPQLFSRRGHVVGTHLSPTSSDITTPQASPLVSKRSATPTLLEQLSSSLEELSIIDEPDCSFKRPKTPVARLSAAGSLATLCEHSPRAGHATMNISILYSRSNRKDKPSNISLGTGTRNISPPMPSPVNNNGIFGPPLAPAGTTDPSYQQCRPTPQTPDETQEVSCIEWDDEDDTKSRLTRMRKSFTDLRTAGRTKVSAPTPSPPQPQMNQILRPASHNTNNSLTLKNTTPPRQALPPVVLIAKLTKKPSVRVTRKRSWSHTSAFSEKSSGSKIGTRSNIPTATALPRASSPHLTKKKRFSIAVASKTSGKGKKISMRSLKRWMGSMFDC